MTERRFAESSSVRSSRLSAAFCHMTPAFALTRRASEQMRSLMIGLRLKGIADEPTCLSPNGSPSSPNGLLARMRMSKANLLARRRQRGDRGDDDVVELAADMSGP